MSAIQTKETVESKLALRPVTDADLPFVRELYASTRSEEMAMVPWSDEQRAAFLAMQFQSQLDHYRQYFPNATHDIILLEGKPVGRLYVNRLDQEINIIDLTISPRERNGGIGSSLIRQIIDEAATTNKTVEIYVESFNPSKRLFERLGFTEAKQEDFYVQLQWSPK